MGLFNRKAETKEQIDALRAELTTMHRRLDESEGAKQRLADHLARVEAEHQQLTGHVGDVESRVGDVASKVGDVESVRADIVRLDDLAARVDQMSNPAPTPKPSLPPPSSAPNQESLAVLQQRLDELADTINRQREHIADIAVVATDSVERTDAAVAEMRSAIDVDGAEQTARDDKELRRQLGQLAEKVGAVDSRVNQISLELTNQLSELSGDLERAGTSSDATETLDELVARLDEISGGQERLASEQARYAIRFQSDLADLAERVRRPGTR